MIGPLVDENDILKNNDPFSNFLKEEMGMNTENEKKSNDDDENIDYNVDDDKISHNVGEESFETFSKDTM